MMGDKHMKIALIGYGYWGPNIAKNLNRIKKADLYAICDIDATKLEKARHIYGDTIKYVADYHQILKEVDAFAIALRQDISYPIAVELLKLKKHLFMEKPLALSVEQVLLLGKLSEENGVVLHTDHVMVFDPIIRKMKNLIECGELGELLYFDVSRMNLGPHIKNDINAMWDLAVHDLAVIDYLSGGQEAVKVNAMGMAHFGEKEELTYLTIQYQNVIASVRSSWISPIKERRMIVAGTKKILVFDDVKLDEKLMIYNRGFDVSNDFSEYGTYEARVRLGDLSVPYIEAEDIVLNSLEHFIDCINEKKESLTGYKQAYRVISILEQAGKWLH